MSYTQQFVGSLASQQARELLRPKTFTERLQLILTIVWFVFAVLNEVNLQFFLFFGVLLLLLANQLNLTQEEEAPRTFFSNIFRFAFFFWFATIVGLKSTDSLTLLDFTFDDMIFAQKNVLAVLVVVGIATRYFRFELLRTKTREEFATNYIDFLFQAVKGVGYGAFVVVVLALAKWLPELATVGDTFPNLEDMVLIVGTVAILASSQGPEGSKLRSLMMQELFLASETRLERLRDAAFGVGVVLLIILHVFDFLKETGSVVNFGEWNQFALLLFVVGLVTFFVGSWDNAKRQRRSGLGGLVDQFSEQTKRYVPEQYSGIQEALKGSSIGSESQQWFRLGDDVPLVDKGRTKYTAKKNSVAIPVKETPEGMAVVVVGDSEVTQGGEGSERKTNALSGAATAMIIPHDQWQTVYGHLEAIKPSEETISALQIKGIEGRDQLVKLAQGALSDLQNWAGPQVVAERLAGVAHGLQTGRYGVTESAEGTSIRLPGLTVIDNPDLTFVRFLGFKVLDAKGSTVVSGPFFKIIDTPEYDFVRFPGLQVVDGPGGNLVSLAGITFSEGDKKEIANTIQQIELDQRTSDQFIDSQLQAFLDAPETFLLTRDTSGKKMELLTGRGSDEALLSGRLLPSPQTTKSGHRKEKRKAKHARKSGKKPASAGFEYSFTLGGGSKKERRRVRPDKTAGSADQVKRSTVSEKATDWVGEVTGGAAAVQPAEVVRIEPAETSSQSSSNDRLETFLKLLKISQGPIPLEKMSRRLGFGNMDEFEDWVLSLDLENLQIDWEGEKLVSTDALKTEVAELLQKS